MPEQGLKENEKKEGGGVGIRTYVNRPANNS